MESDETQRVLTLLQESEKSGENVLRQRAELVHTDRIINMNREAFNAIKRKPDTDSVYLSSGGMFIKHNVGRAKELIQKDQKEMSNNVQKLRSEMKLNVQRIQEIEDRGERFANTFNLNPLSGAEMKSVNTLISQINQF